MIIKKSCNFYKRHKQLLMIFLINISLSLLFLQFYGIKQQNDKNINDLTSIVLKESLKKSYSTNGKKIPNVSLINLRNENIDLVTYLTQSKTLLLIYSEVSCNTCVDSLITTCNELVNDSNEYRVIGVAYSSSLNYLMRFSRINKLKFPLLWDRYNALVKGLKINSLPVLFMINEKSIVINSFYIFPQISEFNATFKESTFRWLNNIN